MANIKDINEKKKIGENICRHVLEKIYKRPFPTVRPDFLKNPETGNNLELDGYNEKLRIGFEYNGIQHYVFPNWIHQNHSEFINLVRKDQYKFDVCNREGVYLIVIPYTVPHNQIYDFIVKLLPENYRNNYLDSNVIVV